MITSLPTTITAPGNYALNANLGFAPASGNAVTFATGSVTLDFQGHYITNLGAGKGTNAIALRATDRGNITIKNGTIVGFKQGIYFDTVVPGSQNNINNVIENMRLWANTFTGITIRNAIAFLIEDCQITKIGGRTPPDAAYGMDVTGTATIRHNQVSIVTGSTATSSIGIFGDNPGTYIIGNQVDNCYRGIFLGKYKDNLLSNTTTPFSGGVDAGENN